MRPRQLGGCSCLGPELHLSLYAFLTLTHSPFWSTAGSSSSWPGASSSGALGWTGPGIQHRLGQQVLHAIRRRVPGLLSDRPAVLALQIRQQPSTNARARRRGSTGHPQPPPWLYAMASGHRKIITSRHKPRLSSGGCLASGTDTHKITNNGWSISPLAYRGRMSGYWLRDSLCAREKFAYAKGVVPDPGSPSRNIRGGARARSFAFPSQRTGAGKTLELKDRLPCRRISPPAGIYPAWPICRVRHLVSWVRSRLCVHPSG
jgi:hypothetical protein